MENIRIEKNIQFAKSNEQVLQMNKFYKAQIIPLS